MKKWIKYHLPFYLWAVLIFLGSSLPIASSSAGGGIVDKLLHFTEFAVFTFLLARLLTKTERPFLKRYLISIAISIGCLYGLSNELHQLMIPGRSFEIADLLADLAGSLFGMAAFSLTLKK